MSLADWSAQVSSIPAGPVALLARRLHADECGCGRKRCPSWRHYHERAAAELAERDTTTREEDA